MIQHLCYLASYTVEGNCNTMSSTSPPENEGCYLALPI